MSSTPIFSTTPMAELVLRVEKLDHNLAEAIWKRYYETLDELERLKQRINSLPKKPQF